MQPLVEGIFNAVLQHNINEMKEKQENCKTAHCIESGTKKCPTHARAEISNFAESRKRLYRVEIEFEAIASQT